MKILVLSTSSPSYFLGIWDKSFLVFKEGLSTNISEKIDAEFNEVTRGYNLDLVIVDIGPGSFTGVRTGVAFVKGLCINGNIKCRPVSILDSIAFGKKTFPTFACIDAKHGNGYKTVFNSSSDIDDMKKRNKVTFVNENLYDNIDLKVFENMALLGLHDFEKFGEFNPLMLLPIYGNKVHITVPNK